MFAVIGDTICTGPNVAFPGIPTFSPELFCYMRCAPAQKKAFAKGMEGAFIHTEGHCCPSLSCPLCT